MPKVSVILTSFNHAKYLRESIDSVLTQTFTDFELFIWDDASSDASWEIIRGYSDSRIKIFRNDIQKRGVWITNKVISELSNGKYIAIQHSDDMWEPEKLAKQVESLDANPEVGAVFTHVQMIDEEGNPLNLPWCCHFDQPNRSRHEWLRSFLEHINTLCHPSVLIRKSCYETCGMYRYGLGQTGDFDMWIRLCLKYPIHILEEKLTKLRIIDNEKNMSGNRRDSRIRTTFELSLLLHNFKEIKTNAELFKIFPEIKPLYADKQVHPHYILAMLCVEKNFFPAGSYFGLNLLFELLQDSTIRKQLWNECNFDVNEFIRITGEIDPFNRETIEKLNLQLAERDAQLAERDAQLAGILSSRPWRITAPLRKILSFFR